MSQNEKASDDGLARLKVAGTRICTCTAPVGDAGLAHLGSCKNLVLLTLQTTKVTAQSIAEFKKAVPNCEIEWDGARPGRLRPTSPSGLAIRRSNGPVPGELLVYEPFDDAKGIAALGHVESGASFEVKDGSFVMTAPPFSSRAVARLGPLVRDSAFAVRVRSPQGWSVDFRVLNAGNRSTWLKLWVQTDGHWVLSQSAEDFVDGENRTVRDVVLKESAGPDPDLAAGRWQALAARTIGDDYVVWLNGKRIARGTAAPPPAPARTMYEPAVTAVSLFSWPEKGKPPRMEVDHLAVWKPTPGDTPRYALKLTARVWSICRASLSTTTARSRSRRLRRREDLREDRRQLRVW